MGVPVGWAGQREFGWIASAVVCALMPVFGIAQRPNEDVRILSANESVQTFIIPVAVPP